MTTATRSDSLPDILTVGDFVRGIEASGWFGISAPKQGVGLLERRPKWGREALETEIDNASATVFGSINGCPICGRRRILV